MTIVARLYPQYAQAVEQFKSVVENANPEMLAGLDRWTEKTLKWNVVDAYSRYLNKAEKAHG